MLQAPYCFLILETLTKKSRIQTGLPLLNSLLHGKFLHSRRSYNRCGHCKSLAPIYTKAAEHMKDVFTFAAIDCDDSSNRHICTEYQIQGFPTIKIFHKGRAIDYSGPRTAKALTDIAKGSIEDVVVRLTDLPESEDIHAILFSKKVMPSALWKSLALDFSGKITLCQVKQDQEKLVKHFNIEEFPTLLILPPGEAPILYDGEFKRDPMYQFLNQHATPRPKKISLAQLQDKCSKGLCYVFASPSDEQFKIFASLSQRIPQLYATDHFPSSVGPVLSVNLAKGWYKRYEGGFVEGDIVEWIDSVRMGEGEKRPISEIISEEFSVHDEL